MVSMTVALAASSMAVKSLRSPVKSRQLRSSRSRPVALDQHARNDVEPFVAGGAGDAGKGRHRLAIGEDLLDHDIEWVAMPLLADELAQAAGVLRGIAQAVDVVEAQALQFAGLDQPRHQRMDGAEGGRVLDAQAGEIVDVEEAPVVHRREGDAPIGQPIVLAFEQAMQRGGAGFAVGTIDGKPARDQRGGAVDAGEPLLERWRLAIARRVQAAIVVGERRAARGRPAPRRHRPPITIVRSISP